MCRGITCAILTAVNVVLLVAGLALLICGALLKWNKDLLKKLIETAMNEAGGSLDQMAKDNIDSVLSRIQEMSGPIGNVLFIMGIVLCAIAVVAFVGLCCNIKLVMIVYAILVGAFFVAHLLLVIIYFADRNVLMKYVDRGFMELVSKYVSIVDQTTESVALALMMPSLKCCGYNNYTDFTSSQMKKEDEYNGFKFTDVKIPIPCCNLKMIENTPNHCPADPTPENSYMNVGCKQKIEPLIDTIMKYSLIALAVEAVVLALTILHICWS